MNGQFTTDIMRMEHCEILEYLKRCGQIIETDRREHRRRNSTDARIIAKVHARAFELGLSDRIVNEIEMEAERDAATGKKYHTVFKGLETYDLKIRLYHVTGVGGFNESSCHSIDLVFMGIWPCADDEPLFRLGAWAFAIDILKSGWIGLKYNFFLPWVERAGFYGCQKCKQGRN